MAENTARDDLDRLRRAGYSPEARAGYTHWVRASTGDAATVEELAAVLLADQRGALSWVVPRLNEAARLAGGGGGDGP
jgi:hypothetical protein